jgi:hypothetical protein
VAVGVAEGFAKVESLSYVPGDHKKEVPPVELALS